jgi:S1-C subfamily serine protease
VLARHRPLSACIRTAALAAAIGIFAAAAPPSDPAAAETFSPEILKSVVSVLPEWPGFTGTPGRDGRPKNPEGTAVAVLPGGYLATNVHVIGRAEKIDIRLDDGRTVPVEIIGRDTLTDLALIKAPIDLPVPALAPEPTLGARVCAVGNQFGMGLSVTCGVVSALHRTGTGFNEIEDFIQTDAVVNPGGSGGALVDGQGRLVGLVSAIFTKDSDANIGVNFAASTRLLMRVVADLKDHGRVIRGQAGFGVRELTKAERKTSTGAAVDQLARNGAAIEAGLAVGDIVTAVGNRAVWRASDVAAAIGLYRPGDRVEITLLRGGTGRKATITLAP